MDATETPDEQKPTMSETEAALKLCKLSMDMLDGFSNETVMQILSTAISYQIACRTPDVATAMMVAAGFNVGTVSKIIFSFTAVEQAAQMKAAEELQAREGPPPGTAVN